MKALVAQFNGTKVGWVHEGELSQDHSTVRLEYIGTTGSQRTHYLRLGSVWIGSARLEITGYVHTGLSTPEASFVKRRWLVEEFSGPLAARMRAEMKKTKRKKGA